MLHTCSAAGDATGEREAIASEVNTQRHGDPATALQVHTCGKHTTPCVRAGLLLPGATGGCLSPAEMPLQEGTVPCWVQQLLLRLQPTLRLYV